MKPQGNSFIIRCKLHSMYYTYKNPPIRRAVLRFPRICPGPDLRPIFEGPGQTKKQFINIFIFLFINVLILLTEKYFRFIMLWDTHRYIIRHLWKKTCVNNDCRTIYDTIYGKFIENNYLCLISNSRKIWTTTYIIQKL